MKWLVAYLMLIPGLGFSAELPYTNIDNAQLKTLLAQGVAIYDVRRPEEWRQTGVVAGSQKLTFVDAAGRLNPEFMPRFSAEIDKNTPVILICRTGSRTSTLARALAEQLGYTRVYNVRHGITGWIAESQAVVKD